jgi:F-type H+-transporting ATPase subunit alpha
MGLSVSRIGNKVQWSAMKKSTGMLQLEFVRYKELEKLTRIKAGVSREVEKRLRQGKVLEEVLKQDANMPVAMEDQVMVLFALQNGLLKDTDPSEVRGKLERLLRHIRTQRPELVQDLIDRQELTDEIKEGLHDQLRRFENSAV